MMTPQSKRPLLAIFAQGMARRTVIGCISAILGLCLAGGFIMLVLAVANATPNDPTAQTLVLIGTGLFGCLIFLVIPIGMGALIVYRRGQRWDEKFTPLGLVGSRLVFVSRQWKGTSPGGRPVHVKLYRGPLLYVTVSGSLPSRMAIGTRTGLGQAVGGMFPNQIALTDPDLLHLAASGPDEGWVRGLLDDSGARAAILRLTRDEVATEVRSVILAPEHAQLVINRFRLDLLTTETIAAWLADLDTVIGMAEGGPASS